MKKFRSITDYMTWRGDLTLQQDPFNEVDSVILGMASFIDFAGIVPPPGAPGTVRFDAAMAQYMAELDGERAHFGVIIPDQTLDLAKQASECPRYADAELFAYENVVDEGKEMQFAAVTFRLSDGSMFVSFRGTDDTIVGWKEDFNMYFQDSVPAQERAAAYLNCVAGQYPDKIRTGGHSKGGNLAIWSVVHAAPEVQARLIQAYSNDGPGFNHAMLRSPAYLAVRDRCMTYVPQSSLVGMLMEPADNVKIIYSTQTGLLQHDPFSWDVERNHYNYLPERSAFGEHNDAALRLWVDSMTEEEQRALIGDLFEVLESSGAKTLTEMDNNKRKAFSAMRKTIQGYDRERRKRINRLVGRLISAQITVALPENITAGAAEFKSML